MPTLTQIKQRFWDNDNNLLAGGKVYTYVAGTGTAITSYTDSNGTTENTWPIILDAKGEASIWTNGIVKIDVFTSADVQVTGYPVDYVGSGSNANYGTMPINLNGNMQIAQAGTSFPAPASGDYDLDGWQNLNTSGAVFTITQATGSSAGKLARVVTITTADASVAAGDYIADITKIEGYDIVKLVGNTFTVSFTAKFPVTGIHCVSLRNIANDRSYIHEVNCLVANTYADYSFTVTDGLPTGGTWVYTNTAGLSLSVLHMAGTTYTGTPATADTWMAGNYLTTANQVNDCATVSNVWALEDVRIDLGTVVGTDWPSYQENLAKCQRYARSIRVATGYANGTNTVDCAIDFGEMRTIPTIIAGTLVLTAFGQGGSYVQSSVSSSFPNGTSRSGCMIRFSNFTGLTANSSYSLIYSGDAGSSYNILLSARL